MNTQSSDFGASDEVLLQRSREGDERAFADLWRRHAPAVLASTRSFTGFDPDDIAQEAFERVLVQMRAGGGPDTAFRAYVVMTARNIAINKSKRKSSDEVTGVEAGVFEARGFITPDAGSRVLSDGFTLQVFKGLPVRWQEVLWYREVEDLPVREVAVFLGMSENATSALLKRAREGFKQAWISANLSPELELPLECQWVTERLPQFTRGRANDEVSMRIVAHLDSCERCKAVADESKQIDSSLALSLLPGMMGATGAAGYLAWVQGNSAAPSVAMVAATSLDRNRKLRLAALALALLLVGAIGATILALGAPSDGPIAIEPVPTSPARAPGDAEPRSGNQSPSRPSSEADEADGTEPTEPGTATDDPAPNDPGPPGASDTGSAPPGTSQPSNPTPETTVPAAATLTAAPIDGFETGVLPRIAGTAVPGASVQVSITNAKSKRSVSVTADSEGEWRFTPRGVRGTISISALQSYSSEGVRYVEDPVTIGTFAVGDGLRISVSASDSSSSTLRITRLGAESKNQVVNVESSRHGLIVEKKQATAPGEVTVTVPYTPSELGTLTFWKGDTSLGPQRDWKLEQ